MKLNCIIVDDEPVARKILEEYIEDIDFLQLAGKAENPLKASALLSSQKVDIMFLDINMPQMSGIEFLRSSSNRPVTVLTTAYPDYALEGFELDVLDYLVKPFSTERFLKSCLRAKEFLELKNKNAVALANEQYFFIKCNGKIEKVLYDELIFIEAMQNYVILHTEDRKLIAYLTIKGIEEQLPNNLFIKIHKSTIINWSKIKSIQGNEINLGQTSVAISQGLYDKVMNELVKNKMIMR